MSLNINLHSTQIPETCSDRAGSGVSAQKMAPLTATQQAKLDPLKGKLDALFLGSLPKVYPGGPQNSLQAPIASNLMTMGKQIAVVDRMFDGDSMQTRAEGAKAALTIRRNMAMEVFQQGARPDIEALLKRYGEERSFDEVVSIVGFNRLFVRDIASAGTDVDFILFVDSENQELIDDIRKLMKNSVRPELRNIGIDMEAADYLMIGLSKYEQKLNDTRNALFTLANMAPENTSLITGSKAIQERAFSFTDQQLVEHYGNLLSNHKLISDESLPSFKVLLFTKLQKEGNPFRSKLVAQLQQMASSELYIGKKPYNKKQTIQTIMTKVTLSEREARTAPFSIKFCINRMADLINSTGLNPSMIGMPLTRMQVEKLETLGVILSNIICRESSPGGHPALTLQEGYSEITLEQLQKLTPSDRKMISELLSAQDIEINPNAKNFAEGCYDALWALGDQMHAMAAKMEAHIYRQAFQLASFK